MHNNPVPRAKKSLGQNFLLDKNVLKKIVSFIPEKFSDIVVEIGTGTGSLTNELAKRFDKVITIEKDEHLVNLHKEKGLLPQNCKLIHKDVLSFSFKQLAFDLEVDEFVVVGNLPYNISTQILFKICDEREVVPFACFLFQKEVAQRIVANPGSKDYGVLSIISQYAFDVKIAMDLSPSLFVPRPKVFSSLVIFKRQEPSMFLLNYSFFKKTVKAAFSQRRKKIVNSLKTLKCPRDIIEKCLIKTGIDPGERAENITLKRYVQLSNELYKFFKNNSMSLT